MLPPPPVLRPALTGLKVLLHSIRAHDRHRLIVILRLTDDATIMLCVRCVHCVCCASVSVMRVGVCCVYLR